VHWVVGLMGLRVFWWRRKQMLRTPASGLPAEHSSNKQNFSLEYICRFSMRLYNFGVLLHLRGCLASVLTDLPILQSDSLCSSHSRRKIELVKERSSHSVLFIQRSEWLATLKKSRHFHQANLIFSLKHLVHNPKRSA